MVSVAVPAVGVEGPIAPMGCVSCRNGTVPVLYRGCPNCCPPEAHTKPAWQTNYKPAWYFCDRMLFHPADYTQPYPYRERFNYPWNDPRVSVRSSADRVLTSWAGSKFFFKDFSLSAASSRISAATTSATVE